MTEDEQQKAIDITIKHGVDPKHDDELGLTGRPACIVICRMAAGLEERDARIKQLEQECQSAKTATKNEQSGS